MRYQVFWFFFHTLERCKNSLQTLKGTFFFSVYAFVFFGTTSPTSNMQVGEGKVRKTKLLQKAGQICSRQMA